MRRCTMWIQGGLKILCWVSLLMFFILVSKLRDVGSVLRVSWAEVGGRKGRRYLGSVQHMHFCANAVHLISFILEMCELSSLRGPCSYPLSLVHYRITKEMLASHSGYYCLMKYGFICFPFCRTRSSLRLHKCVTTSTSLQVIKVYVSRQNSIRDEWAIIGKKMSIWLHQVCFLTFPLSKISPLENAVHFTGHCHVDWYNTVNYSFVHPSNLYTRCSEDDEENETSAPPSKYFCAIGETDLEPTNGDVANNGNNNNNDHYNHLLSTFYVPGIIPFHGLYLVYFSQQSYESELSPSPSCRGRQAVLERFSDAPTISWLVDGRAYSWTPVLLLHRWKAKCWVAVEGGSNSGGSSICTKFWRMCHILRSGEMEGRGKKGILKRLNSKKKAKRHCIS